MDPLSLSLSLPFFFFFLQFINYARAPEGIPRFTHDAAQTQGVPHCPTPSGTVLYICSVSKTNTPTSWRTFHFFCEFGIFGWREFIFGHATRVIQTPAAVKHVPYQKGHTCERQETYKYICNSLNVCMSLAGDDLAPNLNYSHTHHTENIKISKIFHTVISKMWLKLTYIFFFINI